MFINLLFCNMQHVQCSQMENDSYHQNRLYTANVQIVVVTGSVFIPPFDLQAKYEEDLKQYMETDVKPSNLLKQQKKLDPKSTVQPRTR